MGTIVDFPTPPDRFPGDRPGLRKYGAPWRAIDLKGKPPEGHAHPLFGPRGKILLARHQVWVEIHSQRLYVITSLTQIPDSRSYEVTFARYKQLRHTSRLKEHSFRMSMVIWNTFEENRRMLLEHLQESMSQDNPECVSFFGLDRNGYRID